MHLENDTINRYDELNSLKAYCRDELIPKYEALDGQPITRKSEKVFTLAVLMIVPLIALIIAVDIPILNGFKPYIIFIGVLTLAYYWLDQFSAAKTSANTNIIDDMITCLGWEHHVQVKTPPEFESLNGHGFIPKWDEKYYDDRLEGQINGIRFTAQEAYLSQGTADNQVNYNLFLLKLPAAKAFNGLTHVRHKTSRLDLNKRRVKDLNPINFSSSEFEHLFEVFATDGVEAHFLLPPNHIEILSTVKQNFQGKISDGFQVSIGNLAEDVLDIFSSNSAQDIQAGLQSITFKDGHIYIILAIKDILQIEPSGTDLDYIGKIQKTLNEIELIFRVFDAFEPMIKMGDKN